MHRTAILLLGGLIWLLVFGIPQKLRPRRGVESHAGVGDRTAPTIARDDKHHLAWPMVCIAGNGDLVCSYSVADVHGGGRFPRQ